MEPSAEGAAAKDAERHTSTNDGAGSDDAVERESTAADQGIVTRIDSATFGKDAGQSVATCPACETDLPSDGSFEFCPLCGDRLP